MRTSDLDYPLPASLIARRPAEPRDSARLLVVSRRGAEIEHRTVRDLPDFLVTGDLLVFNRTAVLPARLTGRRREGGAGEGSPLEGLWLGERADGTWTILLRNSRRLRPGNVIELVREGGGVIHRVELIARDGAAWCARLASAGVEPGSAPASAADVLDRVGSTPLPPYITKARRDAGEPAHVAHDHDWYQTVFADPSERRSVAAPTAGLHFTPALLAAIDARGVARRSITLDVGSGTFKPVESETLDAHPIDSERYTVPGELIGMLRAWRSGGAGRRLAVGTTVVRAIESLPEPLPDAAADASYRAETTLLIAPPYRFRHIDGLLTNFHLPRSTLLALVAAMLGVERVKAIYAESVREGYRFYSYGDAMLILP